MKSRIFYILVLVVTTSSVLGQTDRKRRSSSGDFRQQLIALDKHWNDIRERGDVEALDRLLANGFLHTDEKGEVTTKQQRLAGLRTRKGSVERATNSDYRIRIYGSTAVMSLSTVYANG